MQRSENGKEGRDMNKHFKIYLVQRQQETKVLQTSSSCFASRSKKKELSFIILVRNAIAMIRKVLTKEINCLELCLV